MSPLSKQESKTKVNLYKESGLSFKSLKSFSNQLKNRSESTLFNSLKKKILIVDDEPYNLLGLKIML